MDADERRYMKRSTVTVIKKDQKRQIPSPTDETGIVTD